MNKLASVQGRKIDDFLLPDGMHPNDLWHKILAETISGLMIDLINESDTYGTHKH